MSNVAQLHHHVRTCKPYSCLQSCCRLDRPITTLLINYCLSTLLYPKVVHVISCSWTRLSLHLTFSVSCRYSFCVMSPLVVSTSTFICLDAYRLYNTLIHQLAGPEQDGHAVNVMRLTHVVIVYHACKECNYSLNRAMEETSVYMAHNSLKKVITVFQRFDPNSCKCASGVSKFRLQTRPNRGALLERTVVDYRYSNTNTDTRKALLSILGSISSNKIDLFQQRAV